MAKKRSNGEGSIIKRKDGTWSAYLSNVFDPSTGKFKRKYFYAKTQKEVLAKLEEARNKQKNGGVIDPIKITLGEFLDLWLTEFKKPILRPSTYESYEYIIRLHIKPSLGNILLRDLKPEQIQSYYNQKAKTGRVDKSTRPDLSPRTIRYIHTILKQALEQAVKNEYVDKNVACLTSVPPKKKKEVRVLTLEEQKAFLNALDGIRLSAAFKLALASGVRLGELLALKWEHVDLQEGSIKITQSLRRIKTFDENAPTKTSIIFQDPKTESGKRHIPIPSSVISDLKIHKRKQNEEKLLLGEAYLDNDLVFCTELGKALEPRNFTRLFYSITKKANLKGVNFHALRHTYATRLLEANEHPKVVQELLGHSSITMTLDIYSHVMPEVKKAAAQKINHLFSSTDDNIIVLR